MADVALPALGVSRSTAAASTSKPAKEVKDDTTIAVNALVKTLNATVTKLLFSFSALNAASTESSTGSIDLALKAAKREENMAKIVEALGGTVEKVVRSEKVTFRSSVLRDIRARFAPAAEKSKPEMMDCGSQTVPRKLTKADKAAAAAAAATAAAHDEAVLRQLQAPPQPTADAASACFITAATSARGSHVADAAAAVAPSAAAPALPAAATAARPSTVSTTTTATGSGDSKDPSPRPASAALPGIYERQMQWAAKAAANKEKLRVEKENKEREAEAAAPKPKGAARWAHVESVMKQQRLKEEGTKLGDLMERMEGERERRDQAEAKLREEREKAHGLAAAKAKADEQRKAADERAAAAHQRALEMERQLRSTRAQNESMLKEHAEALEIRDAFGDKGLEEWPMFPGRKLHRTLDSEHFDGRVSQEFRVKDAETGERGVTLLMGRLAYSKASEAQAVLFDTKLMSDLDAARWWQNNAHRFEKVAARAQLQKERAASAGAVRTTPRTASELS